YIALVLVERCAGGDGFERGVDDLLLDAELLRHGVDDVDVEADDLTVLLELERLVGQVGAGGQLALLDQGHPALGGRCGFGIAAAAAGGQGEHGADGRDGQTRASFHGSSSESVTGSSHKRPVQNSEQSL